MSKFKNVSIHDKDLQEQVHKLLDFESKDRRSKARNQRVKPHFPLQFTPNLNSKSKWQVRWHPKAAALVKFTYQIFHGSINTNNPSYNPYLREVLQAMGRCLVCRLSNKEWTHPRGIIIAGNQGGWCSAKIADTLVPQVAPNIVNATETFGIETENIKVLLHDPRARLPTKATTGSAAYDLFPLEEHTIPAHTRVLIPTGLKMEIPTSYYGQISSRSSLSSKHLLDVTAGVIDSDYRGIIKVLLHNHSDQPYSLSPKQSMAQILFLPLAQPPVVETSEISNMERGPQGFGSTNPTTFATEVVEL